MKEYDLKTQEKERDSVSNDLHKERKSSVSNHLDVVFGYSKKNVVFGWDLQIQCKITSG